MGSSILEGGMGIDRIEDLDLIIRICMFYSGPARITYSLPEIQRAEVQHQP